MRLNPIAAVRAPAMAMTMPAMRATDRPMPRAAIAAAAIANGSANSVCSNLTMRPNFTTCVRVLRAVAVS